MDKLSCFFDKMSILHFILHNKLRELRKQKGLTQEDMANALHKNQNAYSLLEQGKSKLDADLIPDICNILNITPIDLFDSGNQFTFNDKVENGYATYIQTLNATHQEVIDMLRKELEEKNKTIQQLLAKIS